VFVSIFVKMRVSDLAANAVEAAYGSSWLRGNGCEEICEL